MFGGVGIYLEDTMFAIVFRERVFLKVDPSSREDFVSRGMQPFAPRKGLELKTYYQVPADILDDEAELLNFARRAAKAAEQAAQKPASKSCDAEEILRPHTAKVRRLAEQLRKLVRRVVPSAQEAGYAGWKLIGYRCPHYFCFIAPQLDHVRLGFEHGAHLLDPKGLLEGSGKQVRFVKISQTAQLSLPELTDLLLAAVAQTPKNSRTKRTASAERRSTRRATRDR
jgi:DNA transformation protein